jgi:hypothetical protein
MNTGSTRIAGTLSLAIGRFHTAPSVPGFGSMPFARSRSVSHEVWMFGRYVPFALPNT